MENDLVEASIPANPGSRCDPEKADGDMSISEQSFNINDVIQKYELLSYRQHEIDHDQRTTNMGRHDKKSVACGAVTCTSVVKSAQAKHPGAIPKKCISQLPQSPDRKHSNVQKKTVTTASFSKNVVPVSDLVTVSDSSLHTSNPIHVKSEEPPFNLSSRSKFPPGSLPALDKYKKRDDMSVNRNRNYNESTKQISATGPDSAMQLSKSGIPPRPCSPEEGRHSPHNAASLVTGRSLLTNSLVACGSRAENLNSQQSRNPAKHNDEVGVYSQVLKDLNEMLRLTKAYLLEENTMLKQECEKKSSENLDLKKQLEASRAKSAEQLEQNGVLQEENEKLKNSLNECELMVAEDHEMIRKSQTMLLWKTQECDSLKETVQNLRMVIDQLVCRNRGLRNTTNSEERESDYLELPGSASCNLLQNTRIDMENRHLQQLAERTEPSIAECNDSSPSNCGISGDDARCGVSVDGDACGCGGRCDVDGDDDDGKCGVGVNGDVGGGDGRCDVDEDDDDDGAKCGVDGDVCGCGGRCDIDGDDDDKCGVGVDGDGGDGRCDVDGDDDDDEDDDDGKCGVGVDGDNGGGDGRCDVDGGDDGKCCVDVDGGGGGDSSDGRCGGGNDDDKCGVVDGDGGGGCDDGMCRFDGDGDGGGNNNDKCDDGVSGDGGGSHNGKYGIGDGDGSDDGKCGFGVGGDGGCSNDGKRGFGGDDDEKCGVGVGWDGGGGGNGKCGIVVGGDDGGSDGGRGGVGADGDGGRSDNEKCGIHGDGDNGGSSDGRTAVDGAGGGCDHDRYAVGVVWDGGGGANYVNCGICVDGGGGGSYDGRSAIDGAGGGFDGDRFGVGLVWDGGGVGNAKCGDGDGSYDGKCDIDLDGGGDGDGRCGVGAVDDGTSDGGRCGVGVDGNGADNVRCNVDVDSGGSGDEDGKCGVLGSVGTSNDCGSSRLPLKLVATVKPFHEKNQLQDGNTSNSEDHFGLLDLGPGELQEGDLC